MEYINIFYLNSLSCLILILNGISFKKILNFHPKFSVEDAVRDLCIAFRKDLIPNSFDNDNYFNVKLLKKLLKN